MSGGWLKCHEVVATIPLTGSMTGPFKLAAVTFSVDLHCTLVVQHGGACQHCTPDFTVTRTAP